jgi:hypothetical protein
VCSGTTAACQLYASGMNCAAPTCASGTQTAYACDGLGTCLHAVRVRSFDLSFDLQQRHGLRRCELLPFQRRHLPARPGRRFSLYLCLPVLQRLLRGRLLLRRPLRRDLPGLLRGKEGRRAQRRVRQHRCQHGPGQRMRRRPGVDLSEGRLLQRNRRVPPVCQQHGLRH